MLIPARAQFGDWTLEDGAWNYYGQACVKLPESWPVESSGRQLFCRANPETPPWFWICQTWTAEDAEAKLRTVRETFARGRSQTAEAIEPSPFPGLQRRVLGDHRVTSGIVSEQGRFAVVYACSGGPGQPSDADLKQVINSIELREGPQWSEPDDEEKPYKPKWPEDLRETLLNPPSGTLYSLHPDWSQKWPEPLFHKFHVLDTAELGADEMKILGTALVEGIERKTMSASCFDPRHGLRLGDYDLVICFACGIVHFYSGEESLGGSTLGGGGLAFVEAVRRYHLVWPGWDYDTGRYAHATGAVLHWTPMADGNITHDYISDSFRFSVEKPIYPSVVWNRDIKPCVTALADGSVVTDRIRLRGRSDLVVELLRAFEPKIAVNVEAGLNQLWLQGQPNEIHQALVFLEELNRTESYVSVVEIRPASGRDAAIAQLEKIVNFYRSKEAALTLSQSPGSSLDRLEYRGVAMMRPLGMTFQCETNLAMGCLGSGKSYVVYSFQAPAQDGDTGLLERVLSSITFERPVTRKMRPQEERPR